MMRGSSSTAGEGEGAGEGAGSPLIGLGGKGRMNTATSKEKENMKVKKMPSPKEMVAHYESKGMNTQEASLKVIDDLQNLLLMKVINNNKTNNINLILTRLESKLDSKPGYPQTLAIGIASGAILPHLAHIWNYVASSFSSSHSLN